MTARLFFFSNDDNISNDMNNCWLPLTAWTVKLFDSNKYWSLHKTAQLEILRQLLRSYVNVSLQHCGCINFQFKIRNTVWQQGCFFFQNDDNISNDLNNCWLPLTAWTVELSDSNKYWSLHKTAQLEILPQLLKSYVNVSLQHLRLYQLSI